MEPIERLANLIEDSVLPQLTSLANSYEAVSRDTQNVRLVQERHDNKIGNLENTVHALKCGENTDIMRGHGSRIANIERHIEDAHKQDAECREKNRKVDEALRLAEQNQETNKKQEERHKLAEKEEKEQHQKIVNRLWMLIVAIVGSAAAAYFTGVFAPPPTP